MERIRYSEGDVDVRLGDHVLYRSMFFWRDWKPGRVSYIPGQSPERPDLERHGQWVGVIGENHTYRGFLVDPATRRMQPTIRFLRRGDGGTLLAP